MPSSFLCYARRRTQGRAGQRIGSRLLDNRVNNWTCPPKKNSPGNRGTPYLFLFIPFFPPWLLPLQDTTQRSFKLSNKTIVSQGSACLLMTAYPLDLFFGHATQKKVPPIPNHFKKGIHLHQIVASA